MCDRLHTCPTMLLHLGPCTTYLYDATLMHCVNFHCDTYLSYGNTYTIWCRSKMWVDQLSARQHNVSYLPGSMTDLIHDGHYCLPHGYQDTKTTSPFNKSSAQHIYFIWKPCVPCDTHLVY